MRYFFLFLIFWGLGKAMQAQGVNIGTATPPHSTATLEVSGVSGGFLLPRLTTSQRNALSNPAIGLQIYNSTTECVETYFSTGWQPTGCACSAPPVAVPSVSGPTQVCLSASGVTFSAAPVFGATAYQWTIPAQDTLVSGQNTGTITVNFSGVAGARTLQVVAQNGCGNAVAYSFTVAVGNPASTFSVSPSSPSVNNPASFTATQAGLASYQWTFSGGSPASASVNPATTTYAVAGTYNATLSVTDVNGCSSTTTQSIQAVNCSTATWNFTTCGQTGRFGPSQSQCNATYGNGVVTVTNGIQFWTVPATGTYRITAAGARGGSSNTQAGSGGATMRGDFTLNQGDVIKLLVGQQGTGGTQSESCAGGGGGSFVLTNANSPLIIAGGGGGSGGISNSPGQGGTTSNTSTTARVRHTTQILNGSSGGNGGTILTSPTTSAAGGGLNTDGANSAFTSASLPTGGKSFLNGGAGGEGISSTTQSMGGFGGGGAGHGNTYLGGGGGGGYSGGPGGYTSNGGSNNSDGGGGGGGGGSWNSGTNQSNVSGNNNAAGFITIQRICP
jgi:hypothetical protein